MPPHTLLDIAFPTLNAEEIDALRPFGTSLDFSNNACIFRAGQPVIDLYVVETGAIDIQNPNDDDRIIATHEAGGFSGDIDLLTQRPPLVSGIARGQTRVLHIPAEKLREILNRIPRFGEKVMNAFTTRRKMLVETDAVGLRVFGPGKCRDTSLVREFLYKNFVPFKWYNPDTPEGQSLFLKYGSPKKTPMIICGDDSVLLNPTLRDLAHKAGIWRLCPDQDADFAIVGAGPAGIAAAVYAASEGLSTVVFDRLGPGGQAGGSSRIENFIGFPAGLSGAELATRGVLQMLKFGARMIAPINIERLEPAPPDSPGQPHILHLDCGAKIKANAILVATGVRWRKLEAANAERFEGSGIYYVCTSVEATLFDKSDVAVVGAGNSAGQAAMYLAECCPERTVHMIIRGELGVGMSSYLVHRIKAAKNIIVRNGTEIAAAHGDGYRLESVTLRDRKSPQTSTLPCAAVFVFIGSDPITNWIPDSVARDKLGFLLTGTDALRSGQWPLKDRDPCPLETTLPGLLAAGDIRSGSTKRVGFAVGDGSLAVTCAHRLRALRN
jgi:thioredoxin reductase (NADPH)